MKDPIAAMTQRIQRYWYIDGLYELSMGGFFFLFWLIYAAASRLSAWGLGWLVPVSQVVLVVGAAWLVSRIVKQLKERLTYPRTGYVAYPQKKGKDRVLRIVISGGIALALSTFITTLARVPAYNSWLPLISGVLIALAMLFIGYRFNLTRFFVLAAYDVAIGWAASSAALEDDQKFALFFCLLGAGFIVSGGLTLIRYLRSTQPAAGRED